jgi:DNA primase
MGDWVDFKKVKAMVSFEQVLSHYGINWLRKKGDELRGCCPIHKGEGQDAFHVNSTKGAFHCFSCGKRGNILDFTAAMENCSVRDAAVKLVGWFSVPSTDAGKGQVGEGKTTAAVSATASEKAELGNKPLGFQLKGVDPDHPYLKTRGISKETAELFGIGFFPGRGSMSGRVVIPLHNERGELVAYAGRSIDETEPKYKLPAGFHKSQVLYNLHRAIGQKSVVVVEGFFDCIKVTAAGWPCVALMGCSMSQQQEELLATHFETVWLMLDGDEAGRQAADEVLPRLAERLFVRIVKVPEGKQPDSMTVEELQAALDKQKTPPR